MLRQPSSRARGRDLALGTAIVLLASGLLVAADHGGGLAVSAGTLSPALAVEDPAPRFVRAHLDEPEAARVALAGAPCPEDGLEQALISGNGPWEQDAPAPGVADIPLDELELRPETPAPAAPVPAREVAPPQAAVRRVKGALRPGDTVASALRRCGVGESCIGDVVRTLSPLYDFRKAPAGAGFEASLADGRLEDFTFSPDPTARLELARDEDGLLQASKRELPVRTVREGVVARIESSLYQAIRDAGESPALAASVADVFAWDLDFSRDQHAGDWFRMTVEKVYRGDRFLHYGRVLAAEYEGRRGHFSAFWFSPDGDGTGHYYLPDGQSAEKSFLATPVEFTRISSRFSSRRRHPILGFTRAHNGTDYAAPRGTPVRALADGVVRQAGWSGASGRLVVIDHDDGLQSYYAHLHRIANGVRPGARVRQKTVIGQVGSTGRSTGPHLHLGIKRHGRWLDPQSLKIRRSDPLPAEHLPAFLEAVEWHRDQLAALVPGVSSPLDPRPAAQRTAQLDALGERTGQ